MKPILAITAVVIGLIPLQSAFAQDNNDLRIRVGAGGQFIPDYVGGDGHDWAPLFNFDMKRGSEPFDYEAPDDNFDIALYSKNGLSLGPVANLQMGRKNKDVGAAVGKIPTTIEAGAFVQYQASETIRLRGELRHGLGGHNGLVASLGADRVWRDGDRYVFSVGPRVLLSDGRYQREWFGVSPTAALASGLPEYRPGAGIHAVAATSGIYYSLGGPIGLFGYARYERLVGDAAKSPIVREYGSRNQTSAGLGLTYTFAIKR